MARACLTKDRFGFGWDGGVHDRHDLSDEQWAMLEPLLPVERTGRLGRPWGAASTGGERHLVADSDWCALA